MIGISTMIKGEKVMIGIDTIPYRKKPCLVVIKGNCETKYASFNNEKAAEEFWKFFYKFVCKREAEG